MSKTYRDVAIEQMIATFEEAMSRVIDWWGELPMPMNEAVESFRVQLGLLWKRPTENDRSSSPCLLSPKPIKRSTPRLPRQQR